MAKIELSMDGMNPDDSLEDELLPEEARLAPYEIPPLSPTEAPREKDPSFNELFEDEDPEE